MFLLHSLPYSRYRSIETYLHFHLRFLWFDVLFFLSFIFLLYYCCCRYRFVAHHFCCCCWNLFMILFDLLFHGYLLLSPSIKLSISPSPAHSLSLSLSLCVYSCSVLFYTRIGIEDSPDFFAAVIIVFLCLIT